MNLLKINDLIDNLRQLLTDGQIPFDRTLADAIDDFNQKNNRLSAHVKTPMPAYEIHSKLDNILNSSPAFDDATEKENEIIYCIAKITGRMVDLDLDTKK